MNIDRPYYIQSELRSIGKLSNIEKAFYKKKELGRDLEMKNTNKLNMNEYKVLIQMAQTGDEWEQDLALTDIIIDISENYMESQLARYRGKLTGGAMLGMDDLRQIFLIACSQAVREADPTIGNPLMYILRKGKWKVVDELRTSYRQVLRQNCKNCGNETRLYERAGTPICPKCGVEGHEHIERNQMIHNDDGTMMAVVVDETMDLQDKANSEMIVAGFRDRLTGRKRDIFDMMIYQGYDRTACKNYIADIAAELGVSKGNINLRLRAIKEEWNKYVDELLLQA